MVVTAPLVRPWLAVDRGQIFSIIGAELREAPLDFFARVLLDVEK